MDDRFASIRPYNDIEVKPVLTRLRADPELLDSLLALRLGASWRPFGWLFRPFVKWILMYQLRGVESVETIQLLIRQYMDRMVARTTAGFTASGLEKLSDGPYLFVSNHRDIALDPAFTNYALHRMNRATCRIAIGDNLLSKSWISDLMRLNKSFIVRRTLAGPRQLLEASKLLAAYIECSLQTDGQPVWIAQREGRAKDGLDRTEPAVIKMLLLGRDKSEPLGDAVRRLNIVPVSIAYELDPCDALKAHELATLDQEGDYHKAEHEDASSIARGIAGAKGRVHIAFGEPLVKEFSTIAEIVAEIDRQVIGNYRLHPTNLWAWERLNPGKALPDNLVIADGSIPRDQFERRIVELPEMDQKKVLHMYANAVSQALAFRGV